MGQLLVTFSAWLFALSTIISWCYYGESGIVVGRPAGPLYRLFYSGLVLLACLHSSASAKSTRCRSLAMA